MEFKAKPDEPAKGSGSLSPVSQSSIGRNKIALKPGRSLMDWIRLAHASNDLAGTGGQITVVSMQELQKHNNVNDAWICVNGKVYNVTPYLDFHPGGESELMRGVGKDATDLFNQIHRWVNVESMLQKCYVGPLRSSSLWLQPTPVISSKELKPPKNDASLPKPLTDENKCSELKIEVNQNDDCVHFILSQIEESVQKHYILTNLKEKELTIILKLEKHAHTFNIQLHDIVSENYSIDVLKENTVKVTLSKAVKGIWSNICSYETKVISSEAVEQIYRPCTLVEKVPVNYNTSLLTFELPAGSTMHVPIGHHIHIKEVIENIEIVRSYTPVLPSLSTSITDSSISDGRHLHLMIKIYSNGVLTPVLNNREIGDTMLISTFTGSFSLQKISKCSELILLAAGTGFTPMIKLIHLLLQPNQEKKIFLFFFNRSEKDILWKDELELLSKSTEKISVCHILSEPSTDWHGESGMISQQLLERLFPISSIDSETFFCVCGSQTFTKATLKCLEELNYHSENIHAFMG